MQNLYQKYRPKNFEEVIGQDKIVQILQNSIKYSKIQNSYLFNGPRGTGKTSLAKIFARAVNCDSLENPLQDNCQQCQYFETAKDYEDIYELDAASNNSVDDIRKIIENSYFQPIKLKYKVYIIDEVHMLSKSAFNALLKTLEEPPEHVIFILATTEVHKIPATILSRCQRLDFQRVRNNTLTAHLKIVLQKEAIEVNDQESLETIASLSDGCVRDSLTLLQKVVIGEKFIDSKIVKLKLNLVDNEIYTKILNFLLNNDIGKLLNYWEDLYSQGISEQSFILGFQKYLKDEIIKNENPQKALFTIIFKINDLEKRAIYTADLSGIIEITFMNIIAELEEEKQLPKETIKIEDKIELKIPAEKGIENNDKLKQNNQKIELENTLTVEENSQNDSTKNLQTKKIVSEVIHPQITKIEVNESISEDLNFSEFFEVMKNAKKDYRLEYTKSFTKIASNLSEKQNYGLAKFFGEGEIKVATANKIIVVTNQKFKISFQKKNEEIKNLLENVEDLKIIDSNEWKILKEYFVKKTKENKQQGNQNINQELSDIEKNLISNIENKLQKKVELMEE